MRKVYSAVCWLVVYIMQVLTFLYSIPITKMIMRMVIVCPKNLNIESGSLIISNHQSKSDPFIIAHGVGFRNMLRIYPLNFPVTPHFMNHHGSKWFLKLLNCYDVGETMLERARALVYTRDLLRQKKTVILFPEGERVKKGNDVKEFNRGLDMLLKNGIPIVMVRIFGFNDWSFFCRSNKTKIHFKKLPTGLTLAEKKKYIAKFYNFIESYN